MSEYAPEYTKRERFFLMLKYMALGVPLFGAANFYFLPWFESYAEKSHCFDYGQFTGVHVVFYGLFVGMPLLLSLLLFLVEGFRSIKVIKFGQNPLPGEKVLNPTKYSYGTKARIKPVVILLIFISIVGFSVRGVFLANENVNIAYSQDLEKCTSG